MLSQVRENVIHTADRYKSYYYEKETSEFAAVMILP
jgi:hypothetical protein